MWTGRIWVSEKQQRKTFRGVCLPKGHRNNGFPREMGAVVLSLYQYVFATRTHREALCDLQYCLVICESESSGFNFECRSSLGEVSGQAKRRALGPPTTTGKYPAAVYCPCTDTLCARTQSQTHPFGRFASSAKPRTFIFFIRLVPSPPFLPPSHSVNIQVKVLYVTLLTSRAASSPTASISFPNPLYNVRNTRYRCDKQAALTV